MAAKNKQRRPGKATNKVKFQHEENDAEAENSGEEGKDEMAANNGEEKAEKDEEFNLDEVLKLGGTQADYVMLAGLDDSNELVDGGKKGTIDDLEEGELEKFITKLGIRSLSGLQCVADEPEGASEAQSKKAKSKKTTTEEEASSSQQKADTKQEVEDKQKKKKKKKKEVQAAAGKKAKLSADVFEFQQRQVLLIKPGGKWFDLDYASEGSSDPQDAALVSRYKALAQQLYDGEVALYKNKKILQKGANSNWMKTVVTSGVLADRMAAMTVLIQDAPVHTLEHVESLVAMVKKKGSRRMGLMALDTLRELLLSDLLPENRKLRTFAQHPFHELEERASGNRDSRDRRLVLWYFEHQLKHHVAEFVLALETVAHDTVAANKAKALATAHELVCSRPEQERALLIQVVNKLGDPEYKTAAKASYLLETLLHKHPNMKAVVCCEVERLMFRPNVSPKAQYYAACFLSQVKLSHDEAELAAKLIAIYFSFFRACVKKKDVESKMLSVLLSGVNRAYPYAGAGDEKVKEQLDTLFRVVHVVKFNTAVQALMLLFQVMDSQQTVSDRYYVALYRKLLDPGLSSSSRQTMFLNLVYKSLKVDIVLRRVKAFVKRLLQVAAEQSASFTCGALYLVSEVMKAKPGLRTLLQDNGDGEDEEFKDLAEDTDDEEGGGQKAAAAEDDEDDEEERFVDADKLEEGTPAPAPEVKPVASWVHHQNLEGGKSMKNIYDPLHRNPLFCGADHTTLWELQRFASHFHPSVALFAQTILQGDSILYTGDPLQDFTLIRFLDRFVFRNPKQLKGKQTTEAFAVKKSALSSLPVHSEEFLSKDESQIPVDEIFFHRFFKKQQQEKTLRRPRQRDGDNESVEDVDDDEFEKILDSYEGDSYFTQMVDDDLDFAGNVKSKKGKKKKEGEEDEEESDSDDEGDLDDEEVSLGSMDEEDFGDELEDEGGMFMDPDGDDDDDDDEVPELDEDDAAFDGSDDEAPPASKRKRKSSEELDFSAALDSKQKKKKKGKKEAAMFVSAEEFGSMLDENAGAKFDSVGVNAVANADRAGVKQLKWEAQRDDWIRGRDAKTLRRKKTAFNKKKTFGRTRPGGKAFAKKRRK
ncbi:uncharacterized protein V6R79_024729 [Siganus canaliculatus]